MVIMNLEGHIAALVIIQVIVELRRDVKVTTFTFTLLGRRIYPKQFTSECLVQELTRRRGWDLILQTFASQSDSCPIELPLVWPKIGRICCFPTSHTHIERLCFPFFAQALNTSPTWAKSFWWTNITTFSEAIHYPPHNEPTSAQARKNKTTEVVFKKSQLCRSLSGTWRGPLDSEEKGGEAQPPPHTHTHTLWALGLPLLHNCVPRSHILSCKSYSC